MSGHMRKMTYQFYMGLTKMAGMNCFAAANFLALVATLLALYGIWNGIRNGMILSSFSKAVFYMIQGQFAPKKGVVVPIGPP